MNIEMLTDCRDDITQFLALCKIENRARKLIPFLVNDIQRIILDCDSNRTLLQNPEWRREGITSLFAGMALHQAIFEPNQRIVLLSPHAENARSQMQIVRNMYDTLPSDFKQASSLSNMKLTMHFGNSSIIIAKKADSCALRGYSIDTLFLDGVDQLSNEISESLPMYLIPPTLTNSNARIYVNAVHPPAVDVIDSLTNHNFTSNLTGVVGA